MDIYPNFEDFKSLSSSFSFIPIYAEIIGDLETPVSSFMKIRKGSYNFLFESAEQEEKTGRYSFLGTSPEFTVKGKGKSVEIYNNFSGEKRTVVEDNPSKILDEILENHKCPLYDNLPGFTGGLVGYFAYDFVRQVEKISAPIPSDDSECPDFFFMFAKDIVIFDHFKRKIIIVTNIDIKKFKSLKEAYNDGCNTITATKNSLAKSLFFVDATTKPSSNQFKSNLSKEEFIKAVKKTKEYIQEGEITQGVISQRWEKKLDVNPFNIYRALRSVNPSPYMFYLEAGNVKMVGSSPEILVKLDDKKAILRPIAGTRRRGENRKDDKALEKELLVDPKERAEHIMLVELGKNDLEKVCQRKSVQVTEFMKVERYSHVMHIVSNIEGILGKEASLTDLIKASFPAGTVSGSPKVRAMEIIEEVEPVRRGLYAGAVGYFSFKRNLDFCITIRTFIVKENKIYIQAGAGIVLDSEPEKEYIETQNKAKGLIEAYRSAFKI
jgi:anthranilate synthase component 1